MKIQKKAFTLVEALVVVILIAIGAALAFSFYDEVVVEGREKAAAAYAIDSARTIGEAAQAYYLRTGTTPGTTQALVNSGDLKAIPDPSRLLASSGIPELLALAHAGTLEFNISYDSDYKLDGTAEGVDGYVDLTGITNEGICGKINERLGKGGEVVTEPEAVVPAVMGCATGAYNATLEKCETAPTCAQGTFNAVNNLCDYTVTTSYAAMTENASTITFNVPVYYQASTSPLKRIVTATIYGYASASPIGSKSKEIRESPYTSSNLYFGGTRSLQGYIPTVPNGIPSPKTIISDGGTAYPDSYSSQGSRVAGYVSAEPITATGTTVYTCPTGGDLQGQICVTATPATAAPTCPAGTYDSGTKTCQSAPVPTCPDGFTLDAGECKGVAVPDGFNPETDHLLTAGSYCYDAGDGTYTFHYPFAVQ